jgi:hypothetical protein
MQMDPEMDIPFGLYTDPDRYTCIRALQLKHPNLDALLELYYKYEQEAAKYWYVCILPKKPEPFEHLAGAPECYIAGIGSKEKMSELFQKWMSGAMRYETPKEYTKYGAHMILLNDKTVYKSIDLRVTIEDYNKYHEYDDDLGWVPYDLPPFNYPPKEVVEEKIVGKDYVWFKYGDWLKSSTFWLPTHPFAEE